MPLAIKLIVSQFLLGIALDEELERLAQTENEAELYHFIYFALWDKLSLSAQQVLVSMGFFGAPALRAMVLEVSEVAETDFTPAVTELVRSSLMEVMPHLEAMQQRYTIHAMTRWFINGPLTDLWRRQGEG
jgi:hypothetical protein